MTVRVVLAVTLGNEVVSDDVRIEVLVEVVKIVVVPLVMVEVT